MTAKRSPLKIGLVIPPESVARERGIRLALDNLARGLCNRGHDVVLFTPSGEPTPAVLAHPAIGPRSIRELAASVQASRRESGLNEAFADCDIMHDHTVVGLALGHRRHGVPAVVTNHGLFDGDLLQVHRHASNHVPLIAVSADQASRAPRPLRVTEVIHHGLDVDRYPFQPEPGNYLVAFGHFQPNNGSSIDHAVAIAADAGLPLLIAGSTATAAEKDFFTEVIHPRLGRNVEYVGNPVLADRAELLGGAVALLHAARHPEPFPLPVVEAMACGTPVVATSAGATVELVDDGLTGIIADSYAELVSAVRAAAGLDRALCRKHVEAHFTLAHTALAHERVYRSVIGRRASHSNVVDLPTPARPGGTAPLGRPTALPAP